MQSTCRYIYIIFLVVCIGPELGVFLEPLSLHSQDVVVLAVNDNSSSEYAGGSHWFVVCVG